MTTKDAVMQQIQDNRTDMRGISPKTETHKRLTLKNEELGQTLRKMKDEEA